MRRRTEHAVLIHLIETCRDAERGFRMAAEEARPSEMKLVFLWLARQRQRFAEELSAQVYRVGGRSASEGTRVAALHRAWMRLKARLAPNRDRAVVREAARGERFASSAYEHAVRGDLAPAARDLVEMQKFGVRIARCLLAQMAPH